MAEKPQNIEHSSETSQETQKKSRKIRLLVMMIVGIFIVSGVAVTVLANHVNGALDANRNEYIEQVKSTYGAESVEIIYKKHEQNELDLVVNGTKFTCEPPSSEEVAKRRELNCATPKIVKAVD